MIMKIKHETIKNLLYQISDIAKFDMLNPIVDNLLKQI